MLLDILRAIIRDSVEADCGKTHYTNITMQLCNDGHLLVFVIVAPALPHFYGFTPWRLCCEMCTSLCFFKNSLASPTGKIHWITQKEMQLPPPSRILITEP